MALPCACYKCARCITQESLKDEECLAVEKKNKCENRDCDNCGFTCGRFTKTLPIKREDTLIYFINT